MPKTGKKENCKKAELIPKFLKFRIPNNGCFDDKAIHEFQKNLLNKEIIRAKENYKSLLANLDSDRTELRNVIPVKCIPSVVFYSRRDRREWRQKQQGVHNNKLCTLSEDQDRPLFNVKNTVLTHGLEKQPPAYVLETLELGPRSAVQDTFDPKTILTELDLFLEHCDKLCVDKGTITDINVKTLDYIKRCKKQKTPRNISMTKAYLKKNDLVAVPFDKGVGICLMKKEQYHEKMNNIISLPQFEKVVKPRRNARDSVFKEEDRILEKLESLLKENHISQELFERLKPTGSQPPRLYGLAKVHKENTPMRPVLSMPGSAYYNVAKTVAYWLSHIPECRINSSTKSVCDQLKNVDIGKDRELVSFDVVSLYTNVPVNEAIHVCADLMFNGKNPTPPVDKATFIALAEIASCDVIMSTHDGYYIQKDGLAMGSPPAPHLANGWMSQFDQTIQGDAKLYTRYMDDILRDIARQQSDATLVEINDLHSSLNLTREKEKDGQLPFLDMDVMNKDGRLSSKWYTKPTNTGLIMNFHSLAPKRYKISVVSGFVHRIFRSCSTWKNFHESLEKAKVILINNQYPPMFFEPIIHRTLTKILTPVEKEDGDVSEIDIDKTVVEEDNDDGGPPIDCQRVYEKSELFKFFVQYRGKNSEHFARSLRKLNAPCTVVMTLRKLKTMLPSLKPRVPFVLRSRIVYQIKCPHCEVSYVGMTTRHLLTRFREHKSKSSGPIKKHFAQCTNSKIRLEDIDILDSSIKSDTHLLTLEALYIRELKPYLNTQNAKEQDYKSRQLRISF